MSILDHRDEYLKNPYFEKHEYSDYTSFYAIISISSIFCIFLVILNIAFCCSRYREYWHDRHTGKTIQLSQMSHNFRHIFHFKGNRWLASIWTSVPHKTPPLDLTELEAGTQFTRHEIVQYRPSETDSPQPQEYLEMQKRESEI